MGNEISNAPGRAKFELVVANTDEKNFRAYYVGTSGDIDVEDEAANAEAAVSVVQGTVIPVSFFKITALNNGAVLYGIN